MRLRPRGTREAPRDAINSSSSTTPQGVTLLRPLEGPVYLEDYALDQDLHLFHPHWTAEHLTAAEVRHLFPSGVITHRAWTLGAVTYRRAGAAPAPAPALDVAACPRLLTAASPARAGW
jgi:hypothetical protein